MTTLYKKAYRLLFQLGKRVCAVLMLSLGLLTTVQAHHSFAMFDSANQVKFTGKVSQFDWTNPHVYIEMDVAQEDGASKHWSIECANISILSRLGWKFNIIKPGDEITVIVAPLRNGQPGALLKQVTTADGSKWGNGNPAGPADPALL